MIRPVPLPDLGKPVQHVEVLAVGPGCHIHEPQRISRRRLLLHELRSQPAGQPPLLSLEQSARVMSDQRRDPDRPPVLQKPAATIQGVETGSSDARRITHVVQPGSGHEHLGVLFAEDSPSLPRLTRNRLHMCPPSRKRNGQMLLSELRRTIH